MIIALTNISCGSNTNDPQKFFNYIPAEQEFLNVSKAGADVLSITVTNIPRSGIKIAMWDTYDIKFHVTYSNNTTEDYPFLVKHFPLESRHYLGEVGRHTIELLVNGVTTRFGFDIIKNKDFKEYNCKFINSNTGKTIYSTTVGYYQTAKFEGVTPANWEATHPDRVFSFNGWDHPLDNICQDMVFYTKWKALEKRYYGVNISGDANKVLYTSKNGNKVNTLLYLGRVKSAPMNRSETIYYKQNDSAYTFKFNPISPYGDTWDELNNSIFNYAIKYTFNPIYGSYLYGSTIGLSKSPIFLNGIESMYNASSKSRLLENGVLIDTSIYNSFDTCLYYASQYANYSATTLPDYETGYYRMILSADFDVYLSCAFSSLGNGKYQLEPNPKFTFSPVATSVTTYVQYSVDGEFGNQFDKYIELSNKTLYEVANKIGWIGNNE